MVRRLSAGLFVIVLFWACGIAPAHASGKTLARVPTRQNIRGRIIAQGPGIPLASFGLNRDNYVFALETKKGEEYVKLSYRFLIHEQRIPDDLFDYNAVLSFSAIRDKSCDESIRLLGTDTDGFSLKYATDAPQLASVDTVLPCYVVTSRDYQGARRRTKTGNQ